MSQTVFPESEQARQHLSRADKRLGKLIEKVGELRIELDPERTIFEALASSIVYQQLHGKAAATILGRFKKIYGIEGRGFPEPAAVLKTDLALLRAAGLSGSKSAAILDLAKKVLERSIPERAETHSMSDEQIIEALTQVRGVGRWTVEMFLIFTLGRTDVLPIHDYGVRKGYAAIFGMREMPTPKKLGEHAARWSPYRSALSWYCWRALELPEYQDKKKNSKKAAPKAAKKPKRVKAKKSAKR